MSVNNLFFNIAKIAFLMSFIAGYIDVTCFIALDHLFTAHVTGNIVIAIAEIFERGSGVMPKLIAIPLFVLIVSAMTSLIEKHQQTFSLLIGFLIFEALLFLMGMYGGIYYFKESSLNSWSYFIVGMIFVSSMAIHNALLRTYMSKVPPCTVMTGNLTQFTIDLTTYCLNLHLSKDHEKYKKTLASIKHFGTVLAGFTLGGTMGVIFLKLTGFVATSFPVIIVLIIILELKRAHHAISI